MTTARKRNLFTLVFIQSENRLLLGYKKHGFGVNKWNGFCSKVKCKHNETILQAAVRELKEESCLSVETNNLKNVAHLEFTAEGDPTLSEVRVFTTNIFEGTPKDTEEMLHKWFNFNDIPLDDMWPDARLWLNQYLLKGKKFFGYFHYNEDSVEILNYKMEDIDSMEAFYANRK